MNGDISCIPSNEEKYISFTKNILVDKFIKEGKEFEVKRELRFVDSFRFMSSSLDTLITNLDKIKCGNISRFYTGRKLELLQRKGIYPYEYLNSVERLSGRQLPPKEIFYSKLNNEDISQEIMNMLKLYGKSLTAKRYETITIYIINLMFFYWQMSLKISETCV